jgi:hypothetical protein
MRSCVLRQQRRLDKRIITRRTMVWLINLGDGHIVVEIDPNREWFIAFDCNHDSNTGLIDRKFKVKDILFYTNKIKPEHAEMLLRNKGFN